MEDWVRITGHDLGNMGGWGILFYHRSIYKVLTILYPEHDWESKSIDRLENSTFPIIDSSSNNNNTSNNDRGLQYRYGINSKSQLLLLEIIKKVFGRGNSLTKQNEGDTGSLQVKHSIKDSLYLC